MPTRSCVGPGSPKEQSSDLVVEQLFSGELVGAPTSSTDEPPPEAKPPEGASRRQKNKNKKVANCHASPLFPADLHLAPSPCVRTAFGQG